MVWESFDVVRFDLGPLLQGQMRIAKLKSGGGGVDILFLLCPASHLVSDHFKEKYPIFTKFGMGVY